MSKCVILGGGTFNKVACHLSLAAPAFGGTVRQLEKITLEVISDHDIDVELKLTKMADYDSDLVSGDDVQEYVNTLLEDSEVKAIIFNVAICDFKMDNPSNQQRLSSAKDYPATLLGVTGKILKGIKTKRPDIFVVGFKTTAGAEIHTQLDLGTKLLEDNNLDLVLANDVTYRRNILLTKAGEIWLNNRTPILEKIAKDAIEWCAKV